MSSSSSIAVSGTEADMPAEHDTRSTLTAETAALSMVGAEPASTVEQHEEEQTATPAVSATRTGHKAKSIIWPKITENLLPVVLSGAMVAMIGFVLTTTNIRISDTNDKIDNLEVRMNDKIDNLEVRMNDKIDNLESKVDNLDDKVDEINLKLTALIAALNKTDDVEAALTGAAASVDP